MRLQGERQPIQYQHCISSIPFKPDLWSSGDVNQHQAYKTACRAERKLCDLLLLSQRKGESNVFYTTVSLEWHGLAAGCRGQCRRRCDDALPRHQSGCFAHDHTKPTVGNVLESGLRGDRADSAWSASTLP